ncbi:MAG TPA: hypothetical protein VEL75_20145, partial [Candidatus Methylomirabilis sp.]|nr:hypothetical protein [Candidatus Methylomirabilis sp.]
MIDLAEISPDALMADTRALARWTRLSGSAEEREAAEYVAGRLRAHGYSVRILTHDAYISLPGEAGLGVLGPVERDIACITHSMGMATPPGGVTAELVHAGAGGPDDLARAGAAGKFALIEGRATPQRALDATRAGVAGLVFISGRIPHE